VSVVCCQVAVCECCVLSGSGLCGELSTADCGTSECDRKTSTLSRP
jgi:hypothetical protein